MTRQRYCIRGIITSLWATFCLLGISPLFAQKERVRNRPYADLKPYYLGFGVGLHSQDLRLSNTGLPLPLGQSLFAEIPEYRPGFSVGVQAGSTLSTGLELRLSPTLHFGDKRLSYSDGNREVHSLLMRTTYLTIPLQLKYAAIRLNNMRPYIGTGVYGAINLGSKRGEDVRLRSTDFGIILSAGCDFYLRYFTLSPELSFSYGIPNVIDKHRPDLEDDNRRSYTQALSHGRTRMIALTLFFR